MTDILIVVGVVMIVRMFFLERKIAHLLEMNKLTSKFMEEQPKVIAEISDLLVTVDQNYKFAQAAVSELSNKFENYDEKPKHKPAKKKTVQN